MWKQISLITVLIERLTFFSKAPFFWENLCGNTQNTFLDKFSLKGFSIFSNLFSINDLLFKNGLLPIKISYQYFQVFLLAHLFLYWLWLTCFISWCHFKLYSLFTLTNSLQIKQIVLPFCSTKKQICPTICKNSFFFINLSVASHLDWGNLIKFQFQFITIYQKTSNFVYCFVLCLKKRPKQMQTIQMKQTDWWAGGLEIYPVRYTNNWLMRHTG